MIFTKDRKSSDQIFVVRQLCEKMKVKKTVFFKGS